MFQTLALYNNVNPKDKSTAVVEIVIMLAIAALLGYLLRYYQTHNTSSNTTTEESIVSDNLQKIEGIGAKIESLLNDAGINTFERLSNTSTATLKEILEAAGSRFQVHDPSSWSKQAKLAVNGDWDKLDDLQNKLRGGRA